MTRLLRRHKRADLPGMLAALDEAVRVLDGRADAAALEHARALITRAGERLRLSGDHTIVALAGATGSGKSSLFNAVAGRDISPVDVRRPTTSRPHACVWGEADAHPLLAWLGVPTSQTTYLAELAPGGSAHDLDGLILLDLPDHDSANVGHRLVVDRLVDLVDVLVWVVDPQKYADALLHERYLRRLAGHDAVTAVALNQTDTLPHEAAAACLSDLRRLVEQDGMRRARVLACSARSGAGLDELRELLADAVQRRRARNDRLLADVEAAVNGLGRYVNDADAGALGRAERTLLIEALTDAAGVPVIGVAVQRSWELRGREHVGWPATRWLGRLRPDPLRRLHLRPRARRDVARSMTRSSVPAPTAMQRAQVDTALRRVYESAAAGLPRSWHPLVRQAAGADSGEVRDQLDAAVVATDLGVDRTPVWWRGLNVVHWVCLAVSLLGLFWLALLAFGSYLRLPEPPTPEVGGFAVPTALLLGGVAAGLVLALLGRLALHLGGRLRRRRAEARLRNAIDNVAQRMVIQPVEAEVSRHAQARDALRRAAGR